MSAAELMILLIVGIVVVGPKRLPEMMRKAGQYVAKLRRLSTDLRNQSGIDRILREEGLEKEIRELRALRESLSKHALFDSLVNAANKPATSAARSVSGGSTAKAALPAADTSKEPPTADEAAGPSTSETEAEAQLSESAARPVLATGSDRSETTSKASDLIRPAAGAVPRGVPSPALPPRAPNKEPYRSFREREYPSYGPDHYDAFPDDLDESDLEAALEAGSAPGDATPAEGPPAPLVTTSTDAPLELVKEGAA
jgi:sec-independent protein translocase protein TatB